MPLPEQEVLQQGDELNQIRNPGFQTDRLPSPDGFQAPQLTSPIPIPGTGSTQEAAGQEGFSTDFINQILGTNQGAPTPGKLPTYTVSDVYNPRYSSILPGEDSEEAFGKAQPFYNKWANAMVKMGATALGTFFNTTTAIPDTIASIKTGTPYDTAAGNAIDEWLQNLENHFPNYYTKWEQEHPFMSAIPFSGGFANFWGDKFFKNLGFTVGAIGGAVVQDIAVGAITDGLGAVPLIGAQIGKAALWLNKLFSAETKVGRAIGSTQQSRLTELLDLGRSVGRTDAQLMSVRNLAAAAQTVKVTNGARYALNMYGAAASEAGFEAREGYNSVREDLIKAYQSENGYSPTGKELEQIESYARDSANVRFGANLVLLSVSNAIQFDNFLKPYSAARGGYRQMLQRDLENGAGTIGLKKGSIDTFAPVEPSTISGKVWSKVRPTVSPVLTEGVYEEGGQFAAGVAAENYYERKYIYDKGLSKKLYSPDQTPWDAQHQITNVVHSIVRGMADEFGTREGMENVFLGALTGAITGGVVRFMKRNDNKQARAFVIGALNSQGVTGTFRNNYDNAISSQRIAEDMKEAVRTGDLFKYKNFQHEQFVKFITSGLRAGRFDVRMEQLKLLNDMKDEDFKAAFGLDKTQETVGTVTEYVAALTAKANNIKRSYETIDKTFRNPYLFNRKASTEEELLQNEKHENFEEWKQDLTYYASIAPDVDERLYGITKAVKDLSQYVTNDQLAALTKRESMKEYGKVLSDQAKILRDGVEQNISVNKEQDTKRLKSIDKKIESINAALAEKEFNPSGYQKLFADLLNYQINNESDDFKVKVPGEAITQLIEYGKDINRLNKLKEEANKAFDALSTEEGFNKYFRDIERAQEKSANAADKKQKEAEATKVASTEPSGTAKTPEPETPKIYISHEGQNRVYDQGSKTYIEWGDIKDEPVEIVGQSEDGVVVKKADGTIVTIPADEFFKTNAAAEQYVTDLDELFGPQDSWEKQNPPTPQPPDSSGEAKGENTKKGLDKKDITFGLYSTTDPTYDNRNVPFNLFHRRHQNFLFNMGSSDPKVFNQDNREKLKIVPVTAKTASQFGFPAEFTQGKDDVDNAVIRAVYIIDDRVEASEKEQLKADIINAIVKRKEVHAWIKDSIKSDPILAIDTLYDQFKSTAALSAEQTGETDIEKMLGEDIIEMIVVYKSGGLFYVDEHGEKAGLVGQPTDPNDIIFTTLASTSLTFGTGEATEPRYTNKHNQDEKLAQDWWRGQRKRMLDIIGMGETPAFEFSISRGKPNIIDWDAKNSVVDAGLVTEKDLDKPIITIPTVGTVGVLGMFNDDGKGIASAKEGINMPIGQPLLNYGGNMVYINSRKFTQSEAINIFNILTAVADRKNTSSRSAMFKYLNKVIYMFKPLTEAEKTAGVKRAPTASSITIDGPNLFLGTDPTNIQMTPASLQANKNKIVDFLVTAYHAIHNTELNRIAKNPKANDLEFIELEVVDDKIQPKQKWKNYNHYLLSSNAPDGKKRGLPPFTVNIVVPQAGEVPIIQKYAVLSGMEYDSDALKRTNAPSPAPTPPPASVVEKNNATQGVKSTPKEQPKPAVTGEVAELEAEKERVIGELIPQLAAARKADDKDRYKEILVEINLKGEEYNAKIEIAKVKESVSPVDNKKYEWIEVDFGSGPIKLLFDDVVRDKDGNVTDLKPVAKQDINGKRTPFGNPAAVKEVILDSLRKSQVTKDQTTSSDDDFDFLSDNNLGESSDPQYRELIFPNSSYKKGDIDEEIKEFSRIVPDSITIRKVDHVLRTTSGGLAWGGLFDRMVYVYRNAEVGTVYHEAFEAIWGHFLTGSEQQEVYDEFIKRKGTFQVGRGQKAFKDATLKEAKEQLAEEFRDYKISGKLPSAKATKNFFQRLLNFIKKIIFGDASDINLLFKRMNKGYYRNYSTSLRGIDGPQYREVGLENFSEAFIQDVMQGMTVEMLLQAFKEGSDIITQFEEGEGKAAKGIYDKLRENLTFFFENKTNKGTLASEIKARWDAIPDSQKEDKDAVKDQYLSIVEKWKGIKDKWDSFVKEHQRYLKVFNVEFEVDDDGNIAFANEEDGFDDNKNMTEYERDIFTIDAKNSASNKVKLLIATLADSEWAKEATWAAIDATRIGTINIKRGDSQIALPKQVQYAKLFNYILHNTAGINTIYSIWKRLEDMMRDPKTRKNIDANVKRLMNRIAFNKGFEGKTVNQAKLILSLENTLSKQKPGFFRQFVDFQNNTYFQTSVLNSKIDQVKASWIAAIKGSGVLKGSTEKNFTFSESVLNAGDNIKFLNKIGIDIERKDYERLTPREANNFNQAVNTVRALIEKAAVNKTPIPLVSSKQLDFNSRLSALADIYVTKFVGDDTQSQHPNLDNEPTSNFVMNNSISVTVNDANESATKEEFLNKEGNSYLSDIFHRDSYILNNVLFDADGKFSKPVQLGVVEGREKWNDDNKSTSSLTEAERQVYEINNNLNGVFYTLIPADAKSEWALYTGTYLSAANFFGDSSTREAESMRFVEQMYKWLQTEIDLARDYDNRKDIVALNAKLGDRVKGNSLRFFLDILPKAVSDDIHKNVIDANFPLEDYVTMTDMRIMMRDFIQQKANRTFDNLLTWQVISQSSVEESFRLNGFDREFLNNHIGNKSNYDRNEVLNLLWFREMNYVMNNIDLHKMFIGDPAQISQELKRVKSFLSGREVSHVDTIGTSYGFNQWANEHLNKASNVALLPSDPGYHQFKNNLNSFTVYDVDFQSEQFDTIVEAIGEKRADPYSKGNEADGQAHIMPTAYREMLWKSGGRFTAQQEAQFQWEMAWERREKEKEGKYVYSSPELKAADRETLKREPDTEVAFSVLKLLHSGIQDVNGIAVSSIDKASWAPLFYRWVKNRGFENLYNAMQRRGIDYVKMESVHKVGIQKSSYIPLYNEKGGINVLGIENITPESILYKNIGIQVEQTKKEKGQTEGSQARKIVPSDLMSNGVPIDFLADFASDQDAQNDAYNTWKLMGEKERIKTSAIYEAVRRHDEALRKLTDARVEDAMRRLGVVYEEGSEPLIKDKKKVSDYILDELERRELPRNIAYGLEVDPGTNDFVQPLEANAQYSKIRAILYSIVESSIMRPKVNGGQKTMLSVTGWERENRVVKKALNGKPVYTSSELKFYTLNENERTEACEVMLPYWFGKKLMEMGSGKTKEEVIKYLNSTKEGQKLLSGIGFRIPTQGLNSIDFFVVKDFLPEQMGDLVILPSEITVKAGSDFDIDKLNTYMRNFYVDPETGLPRLMQWKGSPEKTKEYISKLIDEGSFINKKERAELDRIIAEETDDIDPEDFFMQFSSLREAFSDEQITREFVKNYKSRIADAAYMDALENEYFDSIEGILSLPGGYGRLVAPNDASELKNIRTEIRELTGANKQESGLGEYGKMLDSTFMVKERQAYVSSKGLVGISAVSQTAHAVSQIVDGGILILDEAIEPRFPYNEIDGKVSLSAISIGSTGGSISNINSQVTDGGVDVSKDKFLAEMGITTDTAKIFLAFVRMGSTPRWASRFLNQPSIQLYLKTKAIHDSVSGINPSIKPLAAWRIVNRVMAAFGVKKTAVKNSIQPERYTIEEMDAAIMKYAAGERFTKEEGIKQIQILEDFRKYDSLSWDMFHFYQGYNWDTARLGDPNAIRLKDLKFSKANYLSITPANKVMTDTFIGSMKNAVQILDAGLRSVINIQRGAGDNILNGIARDLFFRRGLTELARRNILLTAELSMVDFVIHTNSNIAGRPINGHMDYLMLSDAPVARYIQAIQKSHDKNLSNNPFIKNLLANLDTRQGYPSVISLIDRDYDTYTSNVWTDSFRKMKDDASSISITNDPSYDKSVAQVYMGLVVQAIIQGGSRKGNGSFTRLIPNETYSVITRDALKNMNLTGFYENKVLYRANWADDRLVPRVEMELSDPQDPMSPLRYPYLSAPSFKEVMKDLMKVDNPPLILNLPSFGYGDKTCVKIVDLVRDPNTKQVIQMKARLFTRVQVEDIDGATPVSIQKYRVLFKEINAWGDRAVGEFYDEARKSKLPNNIKVNEVSDDLLIYGLYKAGYKPNVSDMAMFNIITAIEGDDGGEVDENGNESPDPDVPQTPVPKNPIVPSAAQEPNRLPHTEPMNYPMPKADNIFGEDTTTFDAILAGDRTSTTRKYWHNVAKGVINSPEELKGKIITFQAPDGRTVDVEVDNVHQISEEDIKDNDFMDDWSESEGWTKKHLRDANHVGAWVVDFELINQFSFKESDIEENLPASLASKLVAKFRAGSYSYFDEFDMMRYYEQLNITPDEKEAFRKYLTSEGILTAPARNPNQLALFKEVQDKINDCLK
jgi:hypothetical protein